MRNLARKAALTAFTFVADVDILPSPGFAHALRTALPRIAENCAQCAFVVPTYEVEAAAKFPRDKDELLRLVKMGKARPFHENILVQNQFATNFSM